MEPFALPENFADLDIDALVELAAEIQAAALAIEDKAAEIDYIRSCRDARAEVLARIENKRDAAALAAELETEVPAAPEAPAEELAADDDADEAAADDADEDLAADAPAEAPAVEAPVAEAAAEVVAEAEAVVEAAAADVAAEKPVPAAEALAAMSADRSGSETPRRGRTNQGFTAIVSGKNVESGQGLDSADLATLIANKRHGMGHWNSDSTENWALATAELDFGPERTLSGDQKQVGVTFADLRDERRQRIAAVQKGQVAPIVAAGGPCAPLSPNYEIISCADTITQLQDFFDVVSADRGGVRYTVPPDFTFLSGGIVVNDKTVTQAKTSVSVVNCPTEEEVCVRAVSRRVLFDNLNFRVYPEYVEYMLQHLQVLESQAVEELLLTRLNEEISGGAATDLTGALHSTYGASRSVVSILAKAALNKRKRENMALDAPLDVVVPDEMLLAMQLDLINDGYMGAGFATAPLVDVQTEMLRRFGLNVGTYYYGLGTIPGIAADATFPASQHNGAVATAGVMPTQGRVYMMTPGSVVAVDGGALDVGLVRDSVLNQTNDVELFAERWVELAHVGCPIDAFDMSYCPTGAAPSQGVAVEACP